jgi:hypothetical protein
MADWRAKRSIKLQKQGNSFSADATPGKDIEKQIAEFDRQVNKEIDKQERKDKR